MHPLSYVRKRKKPKEKYDREKEGKKESKHM
jgi:hypothetical protein